MMLSTYNRFRALGEFVDLCLKAEDRVFNVHRVVVCAASDYFDNLVRRDGIDRDFSSEALELHDVSATDLEILLDFIYTSELSIDISACFQVYILADYLMLNEALDVIRQRFLEELNEPLTINTSFLVSCLELAYKYHDEILKSACLAIVQHYPLKHFDALQHCEESDLMEIVEDGKFIFYDDNFLYLGSSYVSNCLRILDSYFKQSSRGDAARDHIAKRFREQTTAISPYCCPTELLPSPYPLARVSTEFGCLQEDFDDIIETHADFPPEEWTIAGIKFYFIDECDNGEDQIGGLDVTYRNLWTGEMKVSPFSAATQVSEAKTVSCELEPGETIRSVKIHNWSLLESIEFITSKRRIIGPFGTCVGRCLIYGISDECNVGVHKYREGVLCLHGFSYETISLSKKISLNYIDFVFSAVPERVTKDCPFVGWKSLDCHV